MILSDDKKIDLEYIKYLYNNPANCVSSMLIFGEPGAGKTSFAKYVAKELNTHFIFGPCYDGMGADKMVYDWDLGTLADAMTTEGVSGREALKDGYLMQALKKSNEQKVLLLIDEIDKAKPSVDTFLLSYLQECMLNDPIAGVIHGKKENLFIIFTSNKRRDLEDALDRRFTMIREFTFPEKNELIQQVKMMINIPYNETKFHFLIDLFLTYRSLKVNKKPSQNQIADLIHELYNIGNLRIGRITSNRAKFRALLWKLSQEESDHKVFVAHCKKIYKDVFESYIGSMI
jgi:MoxR-like ATPase